jgi:hypothetical protein
LWVTVVVVEVGTVLCSVVVELGVDASFVSFTLVQAESDTRAAVARQAMMNFVISIIVVWFVTLQFIIAPSAGQRLWGVTLPCGRCHWRPSARTRGRVESKQSPSIKTHSKRIHKIVAKIRLRPGGKVCMPPFDVPTVGRIAFLSDPQGATFGIIKPTT